MPAQFNQVRWEEHVSTGFTEIDPVGLDEEQSYKLLTGVIVPRPIAWVTSRSLAGVVNLAPFSAFTLVSSKPPMLAISVGHKAGVYKDTAQNILATEQFVVHIAEQSQTDFVHESAVEHPADVSEVEFLGLETAPCRHVAPPRLVAAPVAMECHFRQCLEFGDTRTRLIVGEVVAFHVRDGLVVDGKIDTRALDPICRLAGPNYATLGEIVTKRAIRRTGRKG